MYIMPHERIEFELHGSIDLQKRTLVNLLMEQCER